MPYLPPLGRMGHIVNAHFARHTDNTALEKRTPLTTCVPEVRSVVILQVQSPRQTGIRMLPWCRQSSCNAQNHKGEGRGICSLVPTALRVENF